MKLEQQVCSLELAKKLKELRVEQKSLFYWYPYLVGVGENDVVEYNVAFGKNELALTFRQPFYQEYKHISAFTVAELGEMLPETIGEKTWLNYTKSLNGWGEICETISYSKWEDRGNYLEPVRICEFSILPHSKNEKSNKSEADIRAKMLIYLIENKLQTISEEK